MIKHLQAQIPFHSQDHVLEHSYYYTVVQTAESSTKYNWWVKDVFMWHFRNMQNSIRLLDVLKLEEIHFAKFTYSTHTYILLKLQVWSILIHSITLVKPNYYSYLKYLRIPLSQLYTPCQKQQLEKSQILLRYLTTLKL